MSIAEGIQKAPQRGHNLGCEAIQIFTRNPNQWKSKPLSKTTIDGFQIAMKEYKIQVVMTHSIYLINLASVDKSLRRRSEKAFLDEMDRCEALGIPYLVFHPGSYRKSTEQKGIQRLILSMQRLLQKRPDYSVKLCIENTAGAGSLLGGNFEQIADIREKVGYPNRVKVCFDTSHAFAAGYDLRGLKGLDEVLDQFDSIIGLEHLIGFHLNDSKVPLGSHKDRHENIGYGQIGIEPFKQLVNDPRFLEHPMTLETPGGEEWFRKNLRLLFRLRK